MKIVSVSYEYESRTDSEILLIPLSDIHRGSEGMDEKRFYKLIDWIETQGDNCFVIGLGDYGECINAADRRHDIYGIDYEYETPDLQYRKTEKDFELIKKFIKVLTPGNHEYSHWMKTGHDYTNWLATDLNIPYAPDIALLRIKFKRKVGKTGDRRTLDILAYHGYTNARTDSYKVKIIHDMKKILPQAHIFLMGHVHRLGEGLPTTHLWVDKSDRQREMNQYYYFTGSYVKNYEPGKKSKLRRSKPFSSYAGRKAYPPTTIGSPIIHVKPNRSENGADSPFNIRYETMDWVL